MIDELLSIRILLLESCAWLKLIIRNGLQQGRLSQIMAKEVGDVKLMQYNLMQMMQNRIDSNCAGWNVTDGETLSAMDECKRILTRWIVQCLIGMMKRWKLKFTMRRGSMQTIPEEVWRYAL